MNLTESRSLQLFTENTDRIEPLHITADVEYILVPIQYSGGFDTIPRIRLRCKRSQMPCNIVNFISVNRESEVGRGRQQGEDVRKKERSKVEKTPAGEEKKCREGIGYHNHGFANVQ